MHEINAFYSYSRRDEKYREELETHLALLRRKGVIRAWGFREIVPGTTWKQELDKKLADAELFLPLVSSDFIASDYCWDEELREALERHRAGTLVVIPIVLRPVDLDGSPLEELQALPTDARPVSMWDNADEAWVSVAKGIRLACERIERLRETADDQAGSTPDTPHDPEEFGILDFMAEFESSSSVLTEAQRRYGTLTSEATGKLNALAEEMTKLQRSQASDKSRKAQKVAGSIGTVLSQYAGEIDATADRLAGAWRRVEFSFPKMIEFENASAETDLSEREALVLTLDQARGSIGSLRETILGTRSSLQQLGSYSAQLRLGVRKTTTSLEGLADIYWTIENSMTQMMSRLTT